MAKCEICSKIPNGARRISFRGTYVTKRSLRVQKPNIRRVRVVDAVGQVKKAYVCSDCLRSGAVKRVVGK